MVRTATIGLLGPSSDPRRRGKVRAVGSNEYAFIPRDFLPGQVPVRTGERERERKRARGKDDGKRPSIRSPFSVNLSSDRAEGDQATQTGR